MSVHCTIVAHRDTIVLHNKPWVIGMSSLLRCFCSDMHYGAGGVLCIAGCKECALQSSLFFIPTFLSLSFKELNQVDGEWFITCRTAGIFILHVTKDPVWIDLSITSLCLTVDKYWADSWQIREQSLITLLPLDCLICSVTMWQLSAGKLGLLLETRLGLITEHLHANKV